VFVIQLCLNIIVDKYTEFLSNMTLKFYCNTATCFGPLWGHHRLSNKNFKKGKHS